MADIGPVDRRPRRSKYPGKSHRKTFSLTALAAETLALRAGEFRFLSESDTVEQLIRTNRNQLLDRL